MEEHSGFGQTDDIDYSDDAGDDDDDYALIVTKPTDSFDNGILFNEGSTGSFETYEEPPSGQNQSTDVCHLTAVRFSSNFVYSG